MANPVNWFEITGKDGKKLQDFYSGVFGWKIDANNPMGYGIVEREDNLSPQGIGIGGGVSGAPPGSEGHVTFYVEVPDVEAALVKAESLGGKRVWGPEVVPGTEIELGHFTDPEGHLIGLTKSWS